MDKEAIQDQKENRAKVKKVFKSVIFLEGTRKIIQKVTQKINQIKKVIKKMNLKVDKMIAVFIKKKNQARKMKGTLKIKAEIKIIIKTMKVLKNNPSMKKVSM